MEKTVSLLVSFRGMGKCKSCPILLMNAFHLIFKNIVLKQVSELILYI